VILCFWEPEINSKYMARKKGLQVGKQGESIRQKTDIG
jgi:hypothetical protein